MTTENTSLAPNTLAFIALANEYCHAIEGAASSERTEFTDNMLRLLPRIYICASDLQSAAISESDAYIDSALDEDYYESMRRNVETVMGEEDTYLDVFEEDMKYSDTPIAASISEGLADLFQVLYNFIETVRDAPADLIDEAVLSVKDDFDQYWSRILCNAFRAINAIRHS